MIKSNKIEVKKEIKAIGISSLKASLNPFDNSTYLNNFRHNKTVIVSEKTLNQLIDEKPSLEPLTILTPLTVTKSQQLPISQIQDIAVSKVDKSIPIDIDNGRFANYVFNNKTIFHTAFTHKSSPRLNPKKKENAKKYDTNVVESYERLEFLGDAVLELAITNHLYNNLKEVDEGVLTKIRAYLVNAVSLSQIATDFGIHQHIDAPQANQESNLSAKNSILADVLESIFGAIYLDSNSYTDTAEIIINTIIRSQKHSLNQIVADKLYLDPKTVLQELFQEKYKQSPSYKVLDQWGKDNSMTFKTGIYFKDILLEEGVGTSKQRSESTAAQTYLNKIQLNLDTMTQETPPSMITAKEEDVIEELLAPSVELE